MSIPDERIASDRFSEYIDELRTFSDTFRVPHGKPEDLTSLLEALHTSEGFAADFGSMIRSVLFREHFKVSDPELLTLVAMAWGGVPADSSSSDLPPVIDQLAVDLREVARRGTVGPPPTPPAAPDEPPEVSPDLDNTIHELEQASPDIEMYRQLLKMQNQSGRAPKAGLPAEEASTFHSDTSSPQPVPVGIEAPVGESAPTRRYPKSIEVLATSLAGLAIALLFTVGDLPIYKAHAAVYLPAAVPASTSPDDTALRIGQLTDQVAGRMLAQPDAGPILRQDVLSRARRDLHLGDSSPIPYAALVAETAGHIKLRHLTIRNLDEITCESWSAQFATVFCKEIVDALGEQTAADSSAPPAATVDTAVQVSPHWYLQGILGLTLGCLAGLWMVSGRKPE